MILLLGASGYMGQAFARELKARDWTFRPLSRKDVDYTSFSVLLDYLERTKPRFLINAAGHTGKPNVDACESERAETLLGNTLLPQTIAHACAAAGVPWGHVSSGCIYAGAKIVQPDGSVRVEKDLTQPEIRELLIARPEVVRGFTEEDPPNFSFRQPPCSFYSGTKALGEESIACNAAVSAASSGTVPVPGEGVTPRREAAETRSRDVCVTLNRCYLWRLRIPFDEIDSPRNYLSKIQRYAKVYDNVNSISHRGDFAWACLELWSKQAPFGIYNVTNPGFVTTRQVAMLVERSLKPAKRFEFWASDEEFYQVAAKAPRSNCVLDVSKLLAAGVRLRPVEDALDDSLKNWKAEGKDAK